ncbi:hypothetical protein ACFRKE_02465 [Kitasatospora indigofera]|uniref:hypothetical protein n=1 Tax=Kitasatospora indigofera TaxID=67307 RepID=UPI0036A1FB70
MLEAEFQALARKWTGASIGAAMIDNTDTLSSALNTVPVVVLLSGSLAGGRRLIAPHDPGPVGHITRSTLAAGPGATALR